MQRKGASWRNVCLGEARVLSTGRNHTISREADKRHLLVGSGFELSEVHHNKHINNNLWCKIDMQCSVQWNYTSHKRAPYLAQVPLRAESWLQTYDSKESLKTTFCIKWICKIHFPAAKDTYTLSSTSTTKSQEIECTWSFLIVRMVKKT